MRDLRFSLCLFFLASASVLGSPGCSDDSNADPNGAASSSTSSGGSSGSSSSSGGSSTSSSGGSSSGGSSSGDPDGGAEAGLTCMGENHEPNDAFGQTNALPAINDCDVNSGTVTSVVSGTADVDYFSYEGTDAVACVVDPTAKLDVDGLELCVLATCKTGTTSLLSCSGGATAATDVPSGTVGCCAEGTAPVTTNFDCTGGDDAATIVMRVKRPAGGENTCAPYVLEYHF